MRVQLQIITFSVTKSYMDFVVHFTLCHISFISHVSTIEKLFLTPIHHKANCLLVNNTNKKMPFPYENGTAEDNPRVSFVCDY